MTLRLKATRVIEKAFMPSGVELGGIRSSKPPAAKPSSAALAGVRRIAKLMTKTNVSGGTKPGSEIIESQVDSTIPLRYKIIAITAILTALTMHLPMELELEHLP